MATKKDKGAPSTSNVQHQLDFYQNEYALTRTSLENLITEMAAILALIAGLILVSGFGLFQLIERNSETLQNLTIQAAIATGDTERIVQPSPLYGGLVFSGTSMFIPATFFALFPYLFINDRSKVKPPLENNGLNAQEIMKYYAESIKIANQKITISKRWFLSAIVVAFIGLSIMAGAATALGGG